MLLKRVALAIFAIALFAIVSKSHAQEVEKPTFTYDVNTGKIEIGHQAKPEEQAAKQETSTEPTKSAQKKPKVIEFSEEGTDEPDQATTEQVSPGTEERASYIHVPENITIVDDENNCITVIEDGKARDCRYEDMMKLQRQ